MPWRTGRAGRSARAFRAVAAQDDLRRDKRFAAEVSRGSGVAIDRLLRGDETVGALMRRLIADDLWRCPGGDITDRAVLLFLPSREGVAGGRRVDVVVTAEMHDLIMARVRVLGTTSRQYCECLIERADILLAQGVLIPDDPEDEERAVAGMDNGRRRA